MSIIFWEIKHCQTIAISLLKQELLHVTISTSREWEVCTAENGNLIKQKMNVLRAILAKQKQHIKIGYKIDTKIGEDGYATKERHYTDHNKPSAHTNPHDHYINWKSPKPGIPNFEKPHINYTNDIPEFKYYKETNNMNIVSTNSFEESRFKTISDFKDCMIRGGEVEFIWKGKPYSITHPDGKISICQGYNFSEAVDVDIADELLDYMLGEDKLRDVITQVEVLYRTI